ncbi:MAG: peptidylprolyl isomerase [Deltaproteobacteria bacterium]
MTGNPRGRSFGNVLRDDHLMRMIRQLAQARDELDAAFASFGGIDPRLAREGDAIRAAGKPDRVGAISATSPTLETNVKIANGTVVAIDYKLHLGDGDVIDASEPGSPLLYIQGAGTIVPGLERALEGLVKDDVRQVVVTPEDGYGAHDPDGIQEVAKEAFGGELPEAGHQYTARGPEGEEVPFIVKEIRPEVVVIDLNHPLAGQTLHFEIAVREVREATAEEQEHGHAHGPDGHHHH